MMLAPGWPFTLGWLLRRPITRHLHRNSMGGAHKSVLPYTVAAVYAPTRKNTIIINLSAHGAIYCQVGDSVTGGNPALGLSHLDPNEMGWGFGGVVIISSSLICPTPKGEFLYRCRSGYA